MLLDRFQSMMAATASFGPHPNRAKGQVRIIRNYQQILPFYPIKAGERPHRLTAGIHVSLRPAEQDSSIIAAASSQPGAKFGFSRPGHTPALHQLVGDHEPDIMAGLRVLSAWVAQSRNDVTLLHAGFGESTRTLLFGFLL